MHSIEQKTEKITTKTERLRRNGPVMKSVESLLGSEEIVCGGKDL